MDLDQALHIERARRRLPRALRDRRRRRLRRSRGPDRRRGAPPRGDAVRARRPRSRCTRRCSPRAPRACCPTRSARRCCGRSTWTRRARAPGRGRASAGQSRAKLDYAGVQKAIDDGTADEALQLLKEVGCSASSASGSAAASACPCPSRRSTPRATAGRSATAHRCPSRSWNAQISLLTGMGAAELMLDGERRHGADAARRRPTARSSGCGVRRRRCASPGRADVDYPEFVRSLDPNTPAGAAMLNACTTLLRGAGYVAFDGGVPEHIEHAALANEYAHVTAPLRRLVDRYAGEVAVALCADRRRPGLGARRGCATSRRRWRRPTGAPHQYERAVPRPGRGGAALPSGR